MKASIAFLSLLVAFVIASPAPADKLEARIDCSTCRCSSAESCTVSTPSSDIRQIVIKGIAETLIIV